MAGVREKIPTVFKEARSSLWGQLTDLPSRMGILSGQSLSYTNLAEGAVCMCLTQKAACTVLNSALSTLFKRQSC